jgi:hypothetical protein
MWSSVFRNPFRQRPRIRVSPPKPHSHSRASFAAMSSASGAAAVLYASAVSQAVVAQQQKKPDDAALAKHHAAGGGGFVNPWESFLNRSVWQIAGPMIMYGPLPSRVTNWRHSNVAFARNGQEYRQQE